MVCSPVLGYNVLVAQVPVYGLNIYSSLGLARGVLECYIDYVGRISRRISQGLPPLVLFISEFNILWQWSFRASDRAVLKIYAAQLRPDSLACRSVVQRVHTGPHSLRIRVSIVGPQGAAVAYVFYKLELRCPGPRWRVSVTSQRLLGLVQHYPPTYAERTNSECQIDGEPHRHTVRSQEHF